MSFDSCLDAVASTGGRTFARAIKNHLGKGLSDDILCADGFCNSLDEDGDCIWTVSLLNYFFLTRE